MFGPSTRSAMPFLSLPLSLKKGFLILNGLVIGAIIGFIGFFIGVIV
jgi:hypothetical protein